MTKREAAEKVAKLTKLARGSSNPHEAASARAQAEKIASEHGLSHQDLESGEMGAAFDDLVDEVKRFVANGSAMPSGLFDTRSIVDQIIRDIKHIREADKAARLKQIAVVIRTAAFVAGDNKVISQIKTTLDTILKNHELVL
jgi:hypothetical protein